MGSASEADKAKMLVVAIAAVAALSWLYPSEREAVGCDGLEVETDALKEEVLRLNNELRAEHGDPPLCVHPQLQRAAQDHAEDMLERDYYSFTTPEGLDADDRIARAGYPALYGVEIHNRVWSITKGVPDPAEVRQAFGSWVEELGRDAYATSSSRFREVGFGMATGKYDPETGSTTTIYVATFGYREQ